MELTISHLKGDPWNGILKWPTSLPHLNVALYWQGRNRWGVWCFTVKVEFVSDGSLGARSAPMGGLVGLPLSHIGSQTFYHRPTYINFSNKNHSGFRILTNGAKLGFAVFHKSFWSIINLSSGLGKGAQKRMGKFGILVLPNGRIKQNLINIGEYITQFAYGCFYFPGDYRGCFSHCLFLVVCLFCFFPLLDGFCLGRFCLQLAVGRVSTENEIGGDHQYCPLTGKQPSTSHHQHQHSHTDHSQLRL